MLSAINDLMLGLLAAVARKEDTELSIIIKMLLNDGKSYLMTIHLLDSSRAKIAKVSKRLRQEEQAS